MSILDSYTLLTALKKHIIISPKLWIWRYIVAWLLNGFSASAPMKCPLLDVSKGLVVVKSATNWRKKRKFYRCDNENPSHFELPGSLLESSKSLSTVKKKMDKYAKDVKGISVFYHFDGKMLRYIFFKYLR